MAELFLASSMCGILRSILQFVHFVTPSAFPLVCIVSVLSVKPSLQMPTVWSIFLLQWMI